MNPSDWTRNVRNSCANRVSVFQIDSVDSKTVAASLTAIILLLLCQHKSGQKKQTHTQDSLPLAAQFVIHRFTPAGLYLFVSVFLKLSDPALTEQEFDEFVLELKLALL